MCTYPVRRFVHLLSAAAVAGVGVRSRAVCFFDEARGLQVSRLVDVPEHEARAETRELERHEPAESTSSPGQQHHLSLNTLPPRRNKQPEKRLQVVDHRESEHLQGL